jgi:hypothetical protein
VQPQSEIGIGLVNLQAAAINKLSYPDWAVDARWAIVGKVGQDDDGYDLYQLERGDESITVPANRLVFMERMLERMKS